MEPETQNKLRKIASIALCQTALDGERDNAATMFFRILRSNNATVDSILPTQQQQKPQPRPQSRPQPTQHTARPRPYEEIERERILREMCIFIELYGCSKLDDNILDILVDTLTKYTSVWTKVYTERIRREAMRIRKRQEDYYRRQEEFCRKRQEEFTKEPPLYESKEEKKEEQPWYKFW